MKKDVSDLRKPKFRLPVSVHSDAWHLSVGKKLAFSFAVVNVIVIFLGVLGLQNVRQMQSMASGIITYQLSQLVDLSQMQDEVQNIQIDLLQAQSASQLSQIYTLGNQVTSLQNTLKQQLRTIGATPIAKSQSETWGRFVTAMAALSADSSSDFNSLTLSVTTHHRAKLISLSDATRASADMHQLVQTVMAQAHQATPRAKAIYQRSLTVSISGILIALLLSVVLAVAVIRRITRPLRSITAQMTEIAESSGDLKRRLDIRSNDELGQLSQAFNRMLNNVQNIIGTVSASAANVLETTAGIQSGSEQVLSVAGEISDASQQIAVGAENQAESIYAATSQLQDVKQGLQHLEQSANAIAIASNHSRDSVDIGRNAIAETVDEMQRTVENISALTSQIAVLAADAERIGTFVQLIADIASQSSLLALNAAIEAARAGEHGRGFGVVAREVKKLAEQSSKAAAEIQTIVHSLDQRMRAAMETTLRSRDSVFAGSAAINTSKDAFARIQQAVDGVDEEARQTVMRIQSMVTTANLVVERMHEVVQIAETSVGGSQAVAASIEEQTATLTETATAIDRLVQMANGLQALIGRFAL